MAALGCGTAPASLLLPRLFHPGARGAYPPSHTFPRGHVLHPKLSSPGGAGQELLVMMALSSLSSGAIPSLGVSFLVTLAGNIPRLEKQQEALIPAFLPVEGLSRAGPAASRAGIGNAARPEPFPAHPGIPTPGAFSEFVFPRLPLFPAASKGCGWRGADPTDP